MRALCRYQSYSNGMCGLLPRIARCYGCVRWGRALDAQKHFRDLRL